MIIIGYQDFSWKGFPRKYLRFKAHVKHSVSLVEDHHRYPPQVGHLQARQDLVIVEVMLIVISECLFHLLIIFIKSLVKNHY